MDSNNLNGSNLQNTAAQSQAGGSNLQTGLAIQLDRNNNTASLLNQGLSDGSLNVGVASTGIATGTSTSPDPVAPVQEDSPSAWALLALIGFVLLLFIVARFLLARHRL